MFRNVEEQYFLAAFVKGPHLIFNVKCGCFVLDFNGTHLGEI
jgi:hypothetical protein